jgi:ParB family chromosome partitioning protein
MEKGSTGKIVAHDAAIGSDSKQGELIEMRAPEISRELIVKEIPISDISISDLNIRSDLQSGTEDSSQEDLAKSIQEKGLLSPLTVLQKDGKYELVVGKRRLMACKSLGWKTVPAIVRTDLDDVDARILSLIENIHRADLNPLDKTRAYQQIYETCGTFARVSEETGVSIQTVRRYLFLLQLAPSIKQRLTTNDGPAGICTLSKLAELFQDSDEQEYMLQRIEGFTQQVQIEILKRSEGNIDRIDGLCEQALGGCFSLLICKGLDGCPHIPQECLEDVRRIISAKTQPIKVGNLKGEVLFG